ncbi:DUF427 domain-containing protein [Sneathiella aquimaris]|uniref:DUF427 domain-containing protein n=1 Tax=Sneathiella aquimaris TaxID=2599305 RepID=UPI00146A4A59|nr:DUF427 domain-containing protein [Sneathiella aquimaris]
MKRHENPAELSSGADTAFYSLDISPAANRIRGYKSGVLIFDSRQCLLMNETHHDPVYYVPKSDINMSLLTLSEFRTFCPFKGNASHWSLELDGQRTQNVAWSYESPLKDAEPIKGYLAFYDLSLDQMYIDDDLTNPQDHDAPSGTDSLTEWLAQGRWSNDNSMMLTRQLVDRLLAIGFPIMRLNVAIRQLHPLIAGESYLWQRETDTVVTNQMFHENATSTQYLQSPLKLVTEGLGGIRQKLTADQTEFDFPIMKDLRDQGATDYVAFPLIFSDGHIHNLTLTSDAPDGFSTSHLGQIYEALPMISRLYEVHKLKANAKSLLQSYLGKSAGDKVLSGLTKRGDGGTIEAAILYCDLVNSTLLTETLSQEAYLDLLNSFFDAVAQAVYANHGDILKFIGDAVLAIFPIEDSSNKSRREACISAAKATKEISHNIAQSPFSDNLSSKTGLHFGQVRYGNIGSEQRLDFTVIGSAANEVARITDICSTLGETALVSEQIASDLSSGLKSAGKFNLKGFHKERELFSFDPDKFEP